MQEGGTMTIEQFGQFIRSQNPEEFTNFTDQEIGQRALERNPENWKYIKTETLIQNNTQPVEQNTVSEYLFFGVIIVIFIVGCYIIYKIGRLITKAYKKADRWLEKTEV